jgi:hypothetical protein
VNDRNRTLDSPDPGLATHPGRHAAGDHEPMVLGAWESWLLRLVLAAAALFALLAGPREAGTRAALAFVISLVPPLIGHLSRVHVPRVLELAWVLGVALIGVSDALALYDRVVHWGKFVHGAEGFLVAAVGGYLLLGYRDRQRLDVHTQIVSLVNIFIGVAFGAFWEFLEFVLDWIRYSDMQKSNTDTMTDMLSNNLGAVLGTLLVFHAYYRWTGLDVRGELGDLAIWVFTPVGQLLDQHGKLLGVLVLLGIALYVAALWFAERPLPFVAPQ